MLLAQVAPHTWPTLLISPTVPEAPQTVNYHGSSLSEYGLSGALISLPFGLFTAH